MSRNKLYIIKDEVTGEFMQGAKGQVAFDSPSNARRSAIHTGWWKSHKTLEFLKSKGIQIAKDYEEFTDYIDTLKSNNEVVTDDDKNYLTHISEEYRKECRLHNNRYTIQSFNFPFNKSLRYNVYQLIDLKCKAVKEE